MTNITECKIPQSRTDLAFQSPIKASGMMWGLGWGFNMSKAFKKPHVVGRHSFMSNAQNFCVKSSTNPLFGPKEGRKDGGVVYRVTQLISA